MARLTMSLLGAPTIQRDGAPIKVDTRKATAMLAFLAVTAQAHGRDSLAGLLWPDYDGLHARAALRRTLSALNKALNGEWLQVDRAQVGLGRNDLWLDIETFRASAAGCGRHSIPDNAPCLSCVGLWERAAALYRGDFMAGFSLRDSPEFDDWQVFQAEGLRRELGYVLEKLVLDAGARSEPESAIGYARRWLTLDPLHEPAHQQLMRLYAVSGQRSAALRQYRDCVAVLDRELGVSPLAATTETYKTVKDDQIIVQRPTPPEAGARTEAPAQPRPGPAAYPLVGRAREWETLVGVYGAAAATGQFVGLEGEAGIGKTRLGMELLAYAAAQGGQTVTARSHEGEAGLAYGLVVETLKGATARSADAGWAETLEDATVAEVGRLLPELHRLRPGLEEPPPLDRPGAPGRFFEAITRYLIAATRGPAPGLVFLDDLQWADDASLDVLSYLVRRLAGRRLVVAGAWRAEQVPAGHRLPLLMGEAGRDGSSTLVHLSRLSRRDVAALVEAVPVAIENPTGEVTGRLYEETEGLPFFVVEFLAAMAGQTDEPSSLPSGVRDLLRARLAPVSETGSQLLAAAAVIGRSFDFETVGEASGRSDEESVQALDELNAYGLIDEVSGADETNPTYDFSHDKVRALVYEQTSLARRRLLHRRVAEALIHRARGAPGAGAGAGRIAHHLRLGGRDTAAAEYFRLAGDHARSLFANREALEHYAAAIALDHPSPSVLHEAIGDLHTLAGDYGAAIRDYEAAAAQSGPAELPELEHKLGNVHLRRRDWHAASSHFDAALDGLGGSDEEGRRSRIYADQSLTLHHQGHVDQAMKLARRALGLAEAAGDERARAQTHNLLGVLANGQANPQEAQRQLSASLELAKGFDDPGAQIAALNNLALAHRATGDLARARELASDALRLCAAQGDRHREAALHNNLADIQHASGLAEEAMSHLKQAVTIFAEVGEPDTMEPEIWKLVDW
ncbi:AAA family ATPase [soil metagenome]